MGAGVGCFVADGVGAGAVSGTTLRVGSGNGGVLRLVFELELLLLFSFVFVSGLMSSIGVATSSAFAFGEALTLAAGLVAPPEGSPSSALPVGDCAGCTG